MIALSSNGYPDIGLALGKTDIIVLLYIFKETC